MAPNPAHPPVAATAGAIHPIADRILLGVVLVVLLGRIERAGGQDLRGDIGGEAVQDLLPRRAGSPALLRTANEDRGGVVRPSVAGLPVRLERSDVLAEGPEERLVADPGRSIV